VRVLLDAHVSSRRVGRKLSAAGHDVLALDQDARLASLPDAQVLALAAEEERIVLTHDVGDFARIAREWAEAGHEHAGLILVTDPRAGFGAILRGVERLLESHPCQDMWIDRVEFLGRG
jgi:hypothetical protein